MRPVGCCGWSYLNAKKYFGNSWKNRFNSKLTAYAELFSVVEVNSTYYKLPRVETAEKWRKEVPKEFEFTVKCSRAVTHEDRFKTERSINAFDETVEIADALRAKIILIQCPPSFHLEKENIDRFEKFLSKIEWNGKLAWEYRGKKNDKELKRLCSEHSLLHCVDPLREEPLHEGIGYYRLHGFGKPSMYNYSFNMKELVLIKEKTREGSYVFFNNMDCYENALKFKKLLGEEYEKKVEKANVG